MDKERPPRPRGWVWAVVVAILPCFLPARGTGGADGAGPRSASLPSQPAEPPYVHKDSGYAFPARMGPWQFDKTHDFSGDGKDVGATYRQTGKAWLDLYVYPAPPAAVGPTLQLDANGRRIADANADLKFRLAPPGYPYVRHYQGCAGNVFEKWTAKIESARAVQARPEKNGAVGILTRFAVEKDGQPMCSELLIFVSRGHFVKLRITYPVEEANTASWRGEYPLLKFEDDQKDTAERLRKAAEGGDLPSMHALSEAMLYGGGVPRDPNSGLFWCRKAADRWYAPAFRTLGLAYQGGLGAEPNLPEALRCLREAAQGDDVPGMHALGVAYANGTGVAKDPQLAAQWFAKAVKKEWVPSLTRLGWMYARGEGVEKDLDRARLCFARAAQFGDTEAQEALKQVEKE